MGQVGNEGIIVFRPTGIIVDSWVRVEGHCDMSCDVTGDEAELRFGDEAATGLQMIVTEEGLENLVRMGTDALNKMRANLDEANFAPAHLPADG